MSIRVNGPTGPRTTTSTKKASKSTAKSGGFASALNQSAETDGVSTAASIDSTSSLSAVDSLLAVQQVDDSTFGKSKKQEAVDWGENILNRLDQIRMSLLSGNIPAEQLHQISKDVGARKGKTGDPVLESILNEIEIRAAVEIAKYSRR